MTSVELLLATREAATELDLVGADVVEVSPAPSGPDVTALLASRIVRELLHGIATRRLRGRDNWRHEGLGEG